MVTADLPNSAVVTYGDALGVAFQMRDDILGLFGDPATTGNVALTSRVLASARCARGARCGSGEP